MKSAPGITSLIYGRMNYYREQYLLNTFYVAA
jgi:hypothetical protein